MWKYLKEYVVPRVSIQGVNLLWGDCIVLPRLGIVYEPPVSVPDAQSRKNDAIPQSDLTPCILTVVVPFDLSKQAVYDSLSSSCMN